MITEIYKFIQSINISLAKWGIVLLSAVSLFGIMQYAARGISVDPDGFYHAKASQMLQAGALKDTFPWLNFTTWNQSYADQHYLYHWMIIPFNDVHSLPLSVIAFSSIFILAFYGVLTLFKIRHRFIWLIILLLGSVDFLFRINLVKANTVSLAMLCLLASLIYVYNQRLRALPLLGILLISSIFVWTYGGFIFVPFLLAAYAFAMIIYERVFSLDRLMHAFLPAVISIAGIILGLWLHPHESNIQSLLYDQLFRTGLGAGSIVPAGNEWLPFNLYWFIKSNILILLVWLLSAGLFFYKTLSSTQIQSLSRRETVFEFWLHATSIGLLGLTLWHRRFIEYWVPFAILASALSLNQYLAILFWQEFKNVWHFWQLKVGTFVIIFSVAITAVYNFNYVIESIKSGEQNDGYTQVSQWLDKNSKSGDIVLNTQWDQFPQLFYYNSKNYYIVGLDPTFMYIHNADAYWKWRLIADDEPEKWESVEQIHSIAIDDLHSKFIFIEKNRNPDIYNYLKMGENADKFFRLGFENDNQAVFQIK